MNFWRIRLLFSRFLAVLPPMLRDAGNQRVFAAIAHDKINAGQSRNGLGIEFCIAAGHDEQGVGLTTVGLGDELARTAITKMSDRAGVDDIDISHLAEFALDEACR